MIKSLKLIFIYDKTIEKLDKCLPIWIAVETYFVLINESIYHASIICYLLISLPWNKICFVVLGTCITSTAKNDFRFCLHSARWKYIYYMDNLHIHAHTEVKVQHRSTYVVIHKDSKKSNFCMHNRRYTFKLTIIIHMESMSHEWTCYKITIRW